MNIIRNSVRTEKIVIYTPNSPDKVKKKQGGIFLKIFNLISSMESYKKVSISYSQYLDW